MKRSKAEEEAVVGSGDVLVETKGDSLADYRDAIAGLELLVEKVQTLRQIEVSLRADADGVASQHDKVLADSVVSSGDDEWAIEELSRLRSRGELFERKLGDVGTRLAAAETELASEQSAVAARFSALWHAYFQHALELAKESLNEQLVAGMVAAHIVELVARCTHAVVAARKLDIRTDDALGLLVQATRLLEAVSAAVGFIAPPYVPPTPTAPELDPLWTPGVPWGDRGINVDEEIHKMHQADPTLTLPRAMRLLYEKFPHIFTPPKEGTLSLNEALPSLSTGVTETFVGHLGDTFSTEEEFKAKIAARKEAAQSPAR